MSDMRASVTIELIDRFTREGQQAARTLSDIAKAADQLGREGPEVAKAGRDVERGIDAMGRGAGKADQALDGLGREIDELERNVQGWMRANIRADASLDGLARAARSADRAADELGRGSARNVQGIRSIGREAENTTRELREMDRAMYRMGRDWTPGGRARVPGAGIPGLGSGFGYGGMAGAAGAFMGGVGLGIAGGAAGAGAVVSASISGAAEDEYEADQLRILAGQTERQFAARDALLKKAGARYGIGTGGAYTIYGGLLQGGMDDQGAAALLEPVVVMAKATQAELSDVAATAMAMTNNLKLAPEQMMTAFDAMALGAKEGSFEVRDMAQNFPTLAAQMGLLGYEGLEGVKSITAMAEVVRTVSGTSSEAATNVENFLAKVTAPDFVKNARELGINIQETMEDARKEGVDPLFAVLEKIKRATGGNAELLSALVPDRQANIALAGLLANLDEYVGMMERMDGAAGTVMKDYEDAIGNAQSAWDRFYSRVSTTAKDLAADALPGMTEALDGMSGVMDEAEDRQGGVFDFIAKNWNPQTESGTGSESVDGWLKDAALEMLFGKTSAERRGEETENAYQRTVGAPYRPAETQWPRPVSGMDEGSAAIVEAMAAADAHLPDAARTSAGAMFTRDPASARVGAAFETTAAEGSANIDAFIGKLRAAEGDASTAGTAAGQAAGDGVSAGFAASSSGVLAQAQELFASLRSVFAGGVTVPVQMGGAAIAAVAATAPADTGKGGRITGTRATGGPFAAGNRYLLGEKGPEVVEFDQPGTVHPAHRTSSMMRRAGTAADARVPRSRRGGGAAEGGGRSSAASAGAARPVNVTINVSGAGNPDAVAARIGRNLETKLAGVLGDVGIG